MTDLSAIKVGDKLFIMGRYNRGRIAEVERITPSGRVIAGTETFDRSGRRRGDSRSWYLTRARPATEDDIASDYRFGLVEKLKGFDWNILKADDLKTINEIVKRAENGRT